MCNPKDTDKQNMQYRVALNLYEKGKNGKAIEFFESYLAEYPSAPEKPKTLYYFANAYLQLDSISLAKEYFKKVLIEGEQRHYEASLYRLTQIAIANNNFDEISKYASELEQISTNAKRKQYAVTALMKAYFEAEKYEKTIHYASLILEGEALIVTAENEALLLRGKSLYKLKKYDEARDVLTYLMTSSNELPGAEANYCLGLILRAQKQYEKSNEMLYELSANYSAYTRWYEEAFLVITENYISLDQSEYAILTLQSVIEHGTLPDVIERVNARLEVLNKEDETEELDGSIDLVDEEIAVEADSLNVQDEEVGNE